MARYEEAQQHYQASYAIRHEFHDPEGMAAALVHLGEIAMMQANYQDGEERYRRAVELYRQISDRGGLAGALAGLGHAAVALGDYQMARQQFQRALQIAVEIRYLPLLLDILTGIGELLLQIGKPERSVGLLALVAHHPASEHETKAKAQNKLHHHEDSLSKEQMIAAVQRGEAGDLDTVIAAVETELAVLEVPADTAVSETGDKAAATPESFVNPLTPREMEVLQHIAQGVLIGLLMYVIFPHRLRVPLATRRHKA
jgi:tetratricopeptide (TPR) repeat protein